MDGQFSSDDYYHLGRPLPPNPGAPAAILANLQTPQSSHDSLQTDDSPLVMHTQRQQIIRKNF